MPQPIDLQTELARVNAAERIQQVADRASMAALQRAAAENQQARSQTETVVQETHHTESERVNAEEHRKNPFMGRRRRVKNADEDEAGARDAAAHPGDQEPHQLDVTI
jgi:hypothetical protein